MKKYERVADQRFSSDKNAEKLFDNLGMNLSQALNLFLSKAVRNQELPFKPTLKCKNMNVAYNKLRKLNPETEESIKEGELICEGKVESKTYKNLKEILKDVDKMED